MATLLRKACDNVRPALKRGIPARTVDINSADRNSMLLCVTHDLRWRIETHRLTVQKRRRKRRRMMTLQPCAGIHQECKARRMRLGESISRKSFDLLKHLLRERARVSTRDHSLLKRFAEARNLISTAFPCSDRASEFIRLPWSESRRNDRERHRLLLKKRHPERLPKNVANCFIWISDGLFTISTA